MGFEQLGRKFRIAVSDTQAYRQFGNAVVVPVVEFVAKAMQPYIEKAVAGTAPAFSEDQREAVAAYG
jgi:DNA (cytosine-5)-methyltransferase 1